MEYMTALQSELDEGKPSLFELLSEQQLASLLPPTIRYLLVLATQRYPRYLLRILNSYDELYALLDLGVQRHFLRTYGGGFTENFYGLKRERVLRTRDGEAPRTAAAASALMRETLKLTDRDVWKNLAVMVGVPYIKRKLDEAYEVYAPQVQLLGAQYNRDQLPADATLKQRIQHYYKWFLRHVYPSLNAAYYFSMLVFNLAYLFSNTAYSSPFLWLVQTRIRRLGAADFHAIEALNAPKPVDKTGGKARPTLSMFHPRTLTAAALPRLLSSLRILLPTSIFALKFLEWWHASDFTRQLSRKASEGLELPPPIVSGLSDPTTSSKPKAAQAGNNGSNDAGSSPTSGSPRRSALKQNSSVALANRPGTPPSGGHTPPTPSSPSSPRHSNSGNGSGSGGGKKSFGAPIAASSGLPILTVSRPTAATSALCPICVKPIVTPTVAQTGFVYCYTCIFHWINGQHDRQDAWMRGEGGEEGWGEDDDDELERAAREAGGGGRGGLERDDDEEQDVPDKADRMLRSRVGRWESGQGRCAVTGKRLLGGTEGLRRVMV